MDVQYNRKNRQYDTVVLAAPIQIANEECVMAVVVKKSQEYDRLYTHEVVVIDKEGNMLFKTGRVNSDENPGSTLPTTRSLLQEIVYGKPQFVALAWGVD